MSPEELRQLYESGQLSYDEYQRELSTMGRSNSAPAGTIGSVTGLRGRLPQQQASRNPYDFISNMDENIGSPNAGVDNIDSRGRLIPRQGSSIGSSMTAGMNDRRFGQPEGNIDNQGRLLVDQPNDQRGFVDRVRDNRNQTRFGDDGYQSPTNAAPQETREEYMQRRNREGYDMTSAGEEWDAMQNQQTETSQGGQNRRGMLESLSLNPWGGDMSSNAFLLGRAIGSEPGSRGRGLGIASGVGSLGLGLARTIGSGIGYANRYDETMDTYRRDQGMDRTYTNQPSYYDRNYSGGQMGKYGGEKEYQDGGETDSTPIDRYQRIMNSRSYMKSGGKKMYQNGGGPDDPPKKQIGEDPYADLGIGSDDRLHGKFIKVKDAGYVNPDGTVLEEPQIVDVDRLAGMKDRLRSLLPNQERTPMQQRITYTFENGGEVGSQDLMMSELDMLMQLKNVDAPNFTPEDDNRLRQLDKNLKQFMQEGGEVQQEQVPQEEQPQVDPELLQIAQEMAQEFGSAEEVQAYLEQEGVRPEMIEQVIELFLMVKQEQGQQQERQPATSGVMRNTMSGDMSMGFKYGGKKNYPKL